VFRNTLSELYSALSERQMIRGKNPTKICSQTPGSACRENPTTQAGQAGNGDSAGEDWVSGVRSVFSDTRHLTPRPDEVVFSHLVAAQTLPNRNIPCVAFRVLRLARRRNLHALNRFRTAPHEARPIMASTLQLPRSDHLVPSSLVPRRRRLKRSPPHASHRWHIVAARRCRISIVPNGRHAGIRAAAFVDNCLGSHGGWLGTSECVASHCSRRAATPPGHRCRRSRAGINPGFGRIPPRERVGPASQAGLLCRDVL